MKWFFNRVKEEPNAFAAIFNICLIQAIAYGFSINTTQLANWNSLIILVLAFSTRQTVVPLSIANSQIKTAIQMPAQKATDAALAEVIAINKENNQ